MNTTEAQNQIDLAIASLGLARQALMPDIPAPAKIKAGADLQKALDNNYGLPVATEDGAVFEGHYRFPSGLDILFGVGSGVVGFTGPAITIPPGSREISVLGGYARTGYNDSVVQIGENTDRQTTEADAPGTVLFRNFTIPTHRGKRGFSIHGQDIRLEDCRVEDVWSAKGQDSQAVFIGNAPGRISIQGGSYSAGSEVILVGGEENQIPRLVPDGILVEDALIFRPLTWFTDGTQRKVKNLFELKNGQNVTVKDNVLSGNWRDPNGGQDGVAVVLTPALDGLPNTRIRQSGEITNVLFEGNSFVNIGGGFNVFGRDYACYTPRALSGLIVRHNQFRINRTVYGGLGQFLKVGAEPESLIFEDNVILQDGSSLVYFYRGTVMDPGTFGLRAGARIGSLTFSGNTAQPGSYGFNMDGNANAGPVLMAQSVAETTFGNNRYSVIRSALPGWIPYPGLFEDLAEVKALRAL